MKFFETLTSIFALVQPSISVPLSLNSTYMIRYNDFLETYNKDFSQETFEVFKQNAMLIDSFNEKNESYTMEINQFADTDKIEYDSNMKFETKGMYYEFEDQIIPEQVDWREHNAVTHVKDQGHCGGCWAFSTTGSVEGIVAIETGKLLNISEQQLIDCSGPQGNHGCEGGIMEHGFQYIIDNGGICSEEDYPYQGVDNQCQDCETIVDIKKYGDIYPKNEKVLKRAVAQQPVSVAIQANISSFRFYKEGIYSDYNCGDQLDHGVLVVGYGTDEVQNMDYWLVKNSWGKLWGEEGYIRILRNINDKNGLCGIAMQPTIPLL